MKSTRSVFGLLLSFRMTTTETTERQEKYEKFPFKTEKTKQKKLETAKRLISSCQLLLPCVPP